MKANKNNEIKRLRRVLQKIVDNSEYIEKYEIDVLVEDGGLFVNIVLIGEKLNVAQMGVEYYKALQWAKRILYLSERRLNESK